MSAPKKTFASQFRDPSEKALGVMLLAPAFLLIALIVVYPIGKLHRTTASSTCACRVGAGS